MQIGKTLSVGTISAVEILRDVIAEHGPILAARVSSAQAKGRAKNYAYWGVADYEIRLRKADGMPTAVATSRASSDRRSERLAQQDLESYCERTGRIEITSIGSVSEELAAQIVGNMALELAAAE